MSTFEKIDLENGKVEVAVYSQTEAALAELKERYAIVPDCSTKAGYDLAAKGIKTLTKYRTSLEKERKLIKQPYIEAGKIIDAEAKRITTELTKLEDPLKAAKKEVDEEEARKKAERIARLQKKVDEIKDFVSKAYGKSSCEIAELIRVVDAIDTENDFYDLTHEATVARSKTLDQLNEVYTHKLSQEAAEQEAEELRAQLEQANQKQKEAEAKLRAEQEAKHQAELASERTRLAEETAATISSVVEPEIAEKPAPRFKMPEPSARPEMVTITRIEYEVLKRDSAMLHALEAAGVDSWDGYETAVKQADKAA